MKTLLLAIAIQLTVVCLNALGATLTVTNLADSGPGTLRERIGAAAADDTIQFAVFGTIVLSNELTISRNLIIRGPGGQFLKISGNNRTRVFNVTGGSVGILSLVICDGRVVGTNGAAGRNGENVMGGGIRVGPGATLGLSSAVISNNVTVGGQGGPSNQFGLSGNGGNALGGGIANLGRVTIVAANVAGNRALGGAGDPTPGSASPGGGGQAWGGGLYSEGRATLVITTVSDNMAVAGNGPGGPGTAQGGGIYNVADLQVAVSTVASNSATGSPFDSGGGISSVGPARIEDVTIFGNQADFGGGLSGGASELSNSILAGNTAVSGPDGFGSITSADYNLIQNTNGLTIAGATAHNIIGQDPLLLPVWHQSGFPIGQILIMVPLRGSPVIDQGDSLNSDQIPFQRPFDSVAVANAPGGTGSDIGAIEYVPALPFLNIQRANNDVVVYWSTNGADFKLESTTNVTATNWSAVTGTPAVIGDQFHVTNAIAGGHRFYRLSAP